MAIADDQLERWSRVGAETTASSTYASVRAALEAKTSKLTPGSFAVYLQGSYRNKTNIFGDSDVDVVVEQISSFGYDVARLTDAQRSEFRRAFPETATYTFVEFRADVEQSLRSYYGASLVEPRTKCIQVKGASGRLNADVVPCVKFRRYDPGANSLALPTPHEGIRFIRRDSGAIIINYPKRHYENAVAKHQGTNEWYKPTVRIFKNFRNRLLSDGSLAEGAAPSYFVECLLYNVPNSAFGSGYRQTVEKALLWLGETCTSEAIDKLVTGSGLQWLFGKQETSWSQESAIRLVNAYMKAWIA